MNELSLYLFLRWHAADDLEYDYWTLECAALEDQKKGSHCGE